MALRHVQVDFVNFGMAKLARLHDDLCRMAVQLLRIRHGTTPAFMRIGDGIARLFEQRMTRMRRMAHILGGDRHRGDGAAWRRRCMGRFPCTPGGGMLLGRLRQRMLGIDPQHFVLLVHRERIFVGQQLAFVLLEAFDAVFEILIDAQGIGERGSQSFLLLRAVG